MTDWLTVEVLAKAVGRGVRDVDVKPLGPGDNFASTTVRAKVTTDQGDVVHLIVKVSLSYAEGRACCDASM